MATSNNNTISTPTNRERIQVGQVKGDERAPADALAVGTGCTLSVRSDAYAYTIRRVISAKSIVATRDRSKTINGITFYTPDDDAEPERFTLRKSGRWIQQGVKDSPFCQLHIGRRASRRDPSV